MPAEKARRFVVCLPDSQNPYMQLTASEALEGGRRLGHQVEVLYAEGDARLQWRQVSDVIAPAAAARADVVILMPVQEGGGFSLSERVLAAGVGCIFINRAKGDVEKLQRRYPDLPVGMVAPDQREAGRIQARQVLTLLPEGGNVVCVHGLITNSSTEARLAGFTEGLAGSKSRVVALLPGNWSAVESERAVAAWLAPAVVARRAPDLLACHSDFMAEGALKALAHLEGALAQQGLHIGVLGCDGVPAGRRLVDSGALIATTVLPTTARKAIELAHDWFQQGRRVPPSVVLPAEPYPAMTALRVRPSRVAS
jgi:ABC-type sugar transport system substrate-binding protein